MTKMTEEAREVAADTRLRMVMMHLNRGVGVVKAVGVGAGEVQGVEVVSRADEEEEGAGGEDEEAGVETGEVGGLHTPLQ
jgi:hypothetical protein